MPKSVTKYGKNGLEFTSNVDRANYTINELSRAALKDVAKVLRKKIIKQLRALPGMKRNRRIYRSMQYWLRKWEKDLAIGFKHDSWYGAKSEFGDSNQPRRGFLKDTTMASLEEIQKIEARYLSAIEDDMRAAALINEDEEMGNDDGD